LSQLDARRERFAQELDRGATLLKAHEAAGYKPSIANACTLKASQKVSQRLDQLARERSERELAANVAAQQKYNVTAERVIGELAKIGFANMQDYLKIGDNGEPIFNYAAITRDQAAAIQEIIIEEYVAGRGENARDVRRIRFKLADKRAALTDLGRHLGLFVDPSVLNLNVANFFTERPPSLAEWKREIEGELAAIPAKKPGDTAVGKSVAEGVAPDHGRSRKRKQSKDLG
jgi:phage terminase small subunit